MWCHNPEDKGMSFSLMELSTLKKGYMGKQCATSLPPPSLSGATAEIRSRSPSSSSSSSSS
jgi:hypothetical protein